MKSEINAAYVLVDYAWAVLKANYPTVWDESKYGGLVPIVPLNEEPEIEEYSGPHIVYGYAEDTTRDLPAKNSGSLTFAIYDDNFRHLTNTLNILRMAFERRDESAKDINRFSSQYLKTETKESPYLGIRFGTTHIGFIEGGTPEDTEGGRQSALISITYEYYTNQTIITEV